MMTTAIYYDHVFLLQLRPPRIVWPIKMRACGQGIPKGVGKGRRWMSKTASRVLGRGHTWMHSFIKNQNYYIPKRTLRLVFIYLCLNKNIIDALKSFLYTYVCPATALWSAR